MLWKVINIKNNGEVEIVAVSNTLATNGKTGLYLKGKTGFLNAETVLKNLCEKLYSSTNYGTARNIKVEDIDNLTGFNPETSDWDKKDYYINNRTQTYTSGGPFWDKDSNTFKSPSSDNSITVEHTYYYYTVNENMPLYNALIAESKTYTGDYSETTNYPLFYWLGSRCADAISGGAYFSVRAVVSGVVDSWGLFSADAKDNTGEYERACGVRPVVTLKPKVKIDKSDTSRDGSSEVKAWNLK